MSTSAHVQSLESIEAVRLAVAQFDEQVADALTELTAELRRMWEWLEHDRPKYWKAQVRKAHEKLHEAQQALHRCLMFPVTSDRPSCYEERLNLEKAQSRLAYCQEKNERVKHWQRTVQHELFEYTGRISQLVRLVEVDMPQALGVLTRIVRRLEDYQSLKAVQSPGAYNDVSFARELWPEMPANGEAASAAVGSQDNANVEPAVSSVTPGIDEGGQHDANV
jgi:exonuclease VII large subunit